MRRGEARGTAAGAGAGGLGRTGSAANRLLASWLLRMHSHIKPNCAIQSDKHKRVKVSNNDNAQGQGSDSRN